MDKKKILIVEDDVFIRDIYEVRFNQEGFEVISAENGLVAMEKLEQGVVPNIILLEFQQAVNISSLLKKPANGGIPAIAKHASKKVI